MVDDVTEQLRATAPALGFPPSRLPIALGVSALVHALVLSALVRLPRPTETPVVVIPVSLVGALGGGSGGGEPAAGPSGPPQVAAAAPEPVATPLPVRAKPRARPRPVPAVAPAAHDEPAPAPVASEGNGSGVAALGAAGGSGGGDGSGAGTGGAGDGGDGSGGARVAYGSNPLPPYPRVARNLGIEGVVLLDILVMPDGRASDVRVLESSGYAPLDDSAVTTVRQRWRFIPARRGDTAIESRVRVPIRFRLEDARG